MTVPKGDLRQPLKDHKLNPIQPFLGYVGIGAKFEWVNLEDRCVLRETTLSQLGVIFALSTLWVAPIWIFLFKVDQIKGGIFGKSVLGLSVLISFPFSMKFVHRLLSRRRIVFSLAPQKIEFFKSANEIEQTLFFANCIDVQMSQFYYRSDSISRKNFKIAIIDTSLGEHVICIGQNEKSLKKIQDEIQLLLKLPTTEQR